MTAYQIYRHGIIADQRFGFPAWSPTATLDYDKREMTSVAAAWG